MSTFDSTVTIEPKWSEWPSRLSTNLRVPDTLTCYGETFDRRSVRREILGLAELHTSKILDLAEQVGLEIEKPMPLNYIAPVIMTGHQPVIFHPGLSFKYAATCRAAQQTRSTALAIVLDTAVGSAGHFETPVGANTDWKISGKTARNLATPSKGLFSKAKIISSENIDPMRQETLQTLPDLLPEADRNHIDLVLRAYQRLEGAPADLSHSIVRRSQTLDTNLYEARLSDLARLPAIGRFINHLIANFERLCSDYNKALDDWRSARNIKNPANPFPNLSSDGKRYELPFWSIDQHRGLRQTLWVEKRGPSVSIFADKTPVIDFQPRIDEWPVDFAEKCRLVPRGAMITLIFRLFASDLFVHGLGGQSYDPFVTLLMQKLLGNESREFVVASENRQISQELAHKLGSMVQLLEEERRAGHHPKQYLECGVFSESATRELKEINTQKDAMIARLKQKQAAGMSASFEGKALQEIQGKTQSIVAKEFEVLRSRLTHLTLEAREAILCRTYPWFLFAEEHSSLL